MHLLHCSIAGCVYGGTSTGNLGSHGKGLFQLEDSHYALFLLPLVSQISLGSKVTEDKHYGENTHQDGGVTCKG